MHTLEVSTSSYYIPISFWLDMFLCHTGGTAHGSAYFGIGTGPIFLDDVACTLNDSQLLECSSRPILEHNCEHHADSGVECEGMFYLVYET